MGHRGLASYACHISQATRDLHLTTNGDCTLVCMLGMVSPALPTSLTLLTLTAAWGSQHQLVLKDAQEQNYHSSCWDGRLSPKRRIMPGRKAKTKPITMQTEQEAQVLLSWVAGQGGRTPQPQAAAGLCSVPCSSAQSSHMTVGMSSAAAFMGRSLPPVGTLHLLAAPGLSLSCSFAF